MKILSLHCDYLKFKPLKKALKKPEELLEKDKKGKEVRDVLSIFVAVEKGDTEKSVNEFVKNIEDIANQVKAKNIILYPYAHLSSNLGAPEIAIRILKKAEIKLRDKKFKVTRAPFGYYKEFELKCKGHPLAELSREIKSEKGKETKTEEVEEKYDPKQLLREITKAKLDRSKLKDNDHRILGQQMDLFSFNDVAPGMAFWHNNGLIIYNELVQFIREELKKQGYEEIRTPEILDKKLWLISGHWEKYRENIFLTKYEDRDFAAKPMNCPGGMLIFKEKPKSYKDLPLKMAEFGIVHRQELSGVLAGLFRVIEFTQDDAHVFCTEKQLEEEILKIIKLIEKIYSKFGFSYRVELSTRPEKGKRIGSDKIWDKSEKALENVLKKNKIKYKVNKGEGAFYGPKIDYHVKDSLGREWQLGTIQLDFSMPERFNLEYTDKNNVRKRPIMIHRAILGSIERFIQVRVLSFTDRNQKYAEQVIKQIVNVIPGLRIDSDFRQTTVPAKVKDAEIMKIPYIILIGDREEKENTLAVRIKGNKKIQEMKIQDFIKKIKKEIEEKTI